MSVNPWIPVMHGSFYALANAETWTRSNATTGYLNSLLDIERPTQNKMLRIWESVQEVFVVTEFAKLAGAAFTVIDTQLVLGAAAIFCTLINSDIVHGVATILNLVSIILLLAFGGTAGIIIGFASMAFTGISHIANREGAPRLLKKIYDFVVSDALLVQFAALFLSPGLLRIQAAIHLTLAVGLKIIEGVKYSLSSDGDGMEPPNPSLNLVKNSLITPRLTIH